MSPFCLRHQIILDLLCNNVDKDSEQYINLVRVSFFFCIWAVGLIRERCRDGGKNGVCVKYETFSITFVLISELSPPSKEAIWDCYYFFFLRWKYVTSVSVTVEIEECFFIYKDNNKQDKNGNRYFLKRKKEKKKGTLQKIRFFFS